MKYNGIDLISVHDRLPSEKGMTQYLLIFHQEGTEVEGVIGFFDPNTKLWARLGEWTKKDGEDAIRIDDVTDWVDYWALMPRWMFEDDETFHKYQKRWEAET